jgi:hypothetical protein
MKTTLVRVVGPVLCAGASLFSASAFADVFPLKSDDMGLDHRYYTSDHATGANQGMGKDIVAMRPVGNDKWNQLIADGVDKTVNTNHLIYGKKVYAMASGTVVSCWRNAPNNAKAGTIDPDAVSHLIGVGGNNVVIKTADGVFVKHSHMIPGSISSAICPNNKTKFDNPSGATMPGEAAVTNGATITKGQLLGLAGNSGNSGGPHLHVHMFKDDAAFPMNFERGMTTPVVSSAASPNGPWTPLKGSTLPTGPILVWAPRSVGHWYINTSGAALQGWFSHLKDSGHMPETLQCLNGGAAYKTEWVPVQGMWQAKFGMSAAELTGNNFTYFALGYSQYKWWYCDSLRAAIWRK